MIWVTERVEPDDTQCFGNVHDSSQRFGRVAVSPCVSRKNIPSNGPEGRLEPKARASEQLVT